MAAYAWYGSYLNQAGSVIKWKDTGFIKNTIKGLGHDLLQGNPLAPVVSGETFWSELRQKARTGDIQVVEKDHAIYLYGTHDKLIDGLSKQPYNLLVAAQDWQDKSKAQGRLLVYHGLVKAGTLRTKIKAIIVIAAVRKDAVDKDVLDTKGMNAGAGQDKIANRGNHSYYIQRDELLDLVRRVPTKVPK